MSQANNVQFHNLQFRHLRNLTINWDNFPFAKPEVSNIGGVTIAYVENQDGTTTFALAINIAENFSKAAGRGISRGKFLKGERFTVTNDAFQTFAFQNGDPVALNVLPKHTIRHLYKALL